jgi:acetyl-CoA synthetase
MPVGYVLPEIPECGSYQDVLDAFQWDVPEQYNIAAASLEPPGDPTSVALRHVDCDGGHHTFTYDKLAAGSNAVAAWLADEGVERGDRVGVCFPTSPELLLCHLACHRLGAVVVPLSVLLGVKSLEYILSDSVPDVVVIDEAVHDRFCESAASFDDVVRIRVSPDGYEAADGSLGGLRTVTTLGRSVEPAETVPDDPALLLYTSGTSDQPKGVLQGHRYLLGSLPGYHCWFHLFDPGAFDEQRVWTPSEWAWAGALFDVVFPTLAIGGTVVSRERRSGFDPGESLALVDDMGVTRAFMPPTALHMIRKADPNPGTNLPSLSVIQCGGEKLTADLRTWAESTFDLVVNEGYGQTEANALAGECRALFPPREGSLGRAYPGHELLVVDESGAPLPAGEPGELAISLPDPVAFLRYWEGAGGTEQSQDDGLLRTGDAAVVDEDGYIYFRGRKDDLIVSSGYRVSPVEIENALEAHESVGEAVVAGVPDEGGGQRILAYVIPAPGARIIDEATLSELRTLVRRNAGSHKIPDDIDVLIDPPQTRSGKIDRSALLSEE